MANENLKKQMVVKLGTTTNTEAQLISNMVDGALSGKGGNDPELENLKKQMVIKLGTTTNEDAQIISNMVDNAAGGGSSEQFKIATVSITYTGNNTLGVHIPATSTTPDETIRIIEPMIMFDTEEPAGTFNIVVPINGFTILITSYSYLKQSQVTITGDAVYQGGMINISGDCEISISD